MSKFDTTNSPYDYLEDKHFIVDTHRLVLHDTLRAPAQNIYDNITPINESIAIINLKINAIKEQLSYLDVLKQKTKEYQRYNTKIDYEIYQVLSSFDTIAKELKYRGADIISSDIVSNRLHFDKYQSKSTTLEYTGFISLVNSLDIESSGSSQLEFELQDSVVSLDSVEFGIDTKAIKELSSMINDRVDMLESSWSVRLYSTSPIYSSNISTIYINGTKINITNSIEESINSYTYQTGVKAIYDNKHLLLESDGRGIELSGDIVNLNLNRDKTYGILHLKSYTKDYIKCSDKYSKLSFDDGFKFNLADVFSELLRKDEEGFTKEELKEFAIESIESAKAHLKEYIELLEYDSRKFIAMIQDYTDEINIKREEFYSLESNYKDSVTLDYSKLDVELFKNAHNADSLEGISPRILLDTNYDMYPKDNEDIKDIYLKSKQVSCSTNIDLVQDDYFNQKDTQFFTPRVYTSENQDIEKL
jgi:hypothetical protein